MYLNKITFLLSIPLIMNCSNPTVNKDPVGAVKSSDAKYVVIVECADGRIAKDNILYTSLEVCEAAGKHIYENLDDAISYYCKEK